MKLIVTDLDGTLLRRDNTISEYTIRVFEQLKSEGNLICFASARGYSMTRYIDLIKPQATIENGGSKINFKGDIIYRNMLSENDVNTIIRMSREFSNGNASICIENDETYFCIYVPDDPERRSVSTYSDLMSFNGRAYDVSVELKSDEWATEIQSSCENCKVQSFTGVGWRQFFADGTSKENALKKLTEHIGINLVDVIAFGDDVNDLGMLKLAGTAVAVSNAIDEVKAVADHITESNDQDGVAIYLEKTILRNE